MSKKRVVVTGLGTINALGHNVPEYWKGLESGKIGIGPIGNIWNGQYVMPELAQLECVGATIENYNPDALFSKRELQLLDPFSQYALVASDEAILDSQIELTEEVRDRTAVILGTSTGGDLARDLATYKYFYEKKRMSHYTIFRAMDSAATSHVSIKYGITGPSWTIQSACASSSLAIAQACQMIQSGMVDFALAGGTENFASYGLIKAWQAVRIMAKDTCRPFSKNRKGLVTGEGAGVFVLESLESAIKRNAKIYAEIAGYGMTSDAMDIASPSEDGAVRVMSKAIHNAGISAADIDYINAHGTGTPLNDKIEISAVKKVFGKHAYELAISSTKSMHGHSLGAAGAMEAIAAIMTMRNGVIPPTINFQEKDPECDLNIVPNHAQQRDVNTVLSNSFGFGGSSCSLIFKKCA